MSRSIVLLVLVTGCSNASSESGPGDAMTSDSVATADTATVDSVSVDTTIVDTAMDAGAEDSSLPSSDTATSPDVVDATDAVVDGGMDAAACKSPALASNTLRYGFETTALTSSSYVSGYWSLIGYSSTRSVYAYFTTKPVPGVYEIAGSLPTSASNVGLYVTISGGSSMLTLDPESYGCVNVTAASDGKLEVSFSHVLFSTKDSSEANYVDARWSEP
jgi:hypothetical protein